MKTKTCNYNKRCLKWFYDFHTCYFNLHCGVQPISPRYLGLIIHQHINFLPCLLIQRHEESSKWPGSSFNFQFTRIVFVSVFEPETSRPAEFKVMGTEIKHFSSRSWRDIVSSTTLSSSPWFLRLCMWAMGETALYIRNWFGTCIAVWRTLF